MKSLKLTETPGLEINVKIAFTSLPDKKEIEVDDSNTDADDPALRPYKNSGEYVPVTNRFDTEN